jgi:mannosyltransferase
MHRRLATYALPATVFALALAFRLYAIDRQSLWNDEGISAALSQRSAEAIVVRALTDVHPPLFYLALALWTDLFGTSEAALRSLSALAGALAAGVTALLGRRWFGPLAGWVAGLAAAVSPLGVHYGQEVRMYALAMLFVALMWLGLDGWLGFSRRGEARNEGNRRRSRWWSLLYGLAALAATLTHYFTAVFVAAAGATGTLVLIGRWRGARARPGKPSVASSPGGQLLAFVALHIALAATYIPQVWLSRDGLVVWTGFLEPISPLFVFGDALRSFAVGLTSAPEAIAWTAVFALVSAAGLARALRAGRREAILAALLWLAVPVAAIAILSLRQPYYQPRFLLPALPAFHLLLGAAAPPLARLGRLRHAPAALAIAVVLLGATGPLWREYFDPRFWRDDYRGVAQAITTTAHDGDAVLIVAPGQVETLDYYLKWPLARYPLPRVRPIDPQATIAELEQIARDHQRLYGVYYVPYEADPSGVIQEWLRTNTFRATSRWYGGVELVVYELGEVGALAQPTDALFGGQLRLLRAAVSPAELAPGDAVRVELTWTAESPPGRPLLLFAHLLDADGRIVAQHDGPPAAAGSEAWTAGAEYRGRLAVLVPPDAAPGAYRLVVGLYDPATGERLALADGRDALPLAEIRVTR